MSDTQTASAPDCCCGHPEKSHAWTNGAITRTAGCGHGDEIWPSEDAFIARRWCDCTQYHPARPQAVRAAALDTLVWQWLGGSNPSGSMPHPYVDDEARVWRLAEKTMRVRCAKELGAQLGMGMSVEAIQAHLATGFCVDCGGMNGSHYQCKCGAQYNEPPASPSWTPTKCWAEKSLPCDFEPERHDIRICKVHGGAIDEDSYISSHGEPWGEEWLCEHDKGKPCINVCQNRPGDA